MSFNDYHTKMRDRFATFDADGDGQITIEDFEALGQRVLDAFKVPKGSDKEIAIRQGAQIFFRNLADITDADRNHSISEEEFLIGAERRLLGNSDGFDRIARPWAWAIVKVADVDGDGKVTIEEWRKALQAMGSTPAGIEQELQEIDRDRDGRVSLDEVMQSAIEFYTLPSSRNSFALA